MKIHLPRRKIHWFILIVFVLLVACTLLAGYRFYQAQKKSIKLEAQNDLSAIADLKVSQITQWRRERIADGDLLFNNLPLLRTVKDFLNSSANTDRKQEILAVMKSFESEVGYESSILFDAKGKVRLSVSRYGDSVGTLARSLFQEVSRQRKAILSDLHKSGPLPIAHMDLMVPLFFHDRHDSSLIGAIMLRINPQAVLFQLIQSWPKPSRTSETLLLEQDGESIVYLNELRHQKNTMLTLRLPISNKQLPASMAVRGIEGIVEGIDYRGVPVLVAIRHIPDSPWYMNAKCDQEEVYESLYSQAWIAAIGTFLVILAVSGIIVAWWRHQRSIFYHDKYSAEVERQALVKHFDYVIKYANDCVLLVNMDGWIVEANDQACKVYGYTREEFAKLRIYDLLSQKTSSQDEKQMRQVEERGGLIYEAEHRRKDGTVFPAEISSRFIKVDEKKFYQSIIRDITERKQADEIIRKSEERFRNLSTLLPQIIFETDEKGNVTFINRQGFTIAGYTEDDIAKGFNAVQIFDPQDKNRALENMRKRLNGEEIGEQEYLIIKKDGSTFPAALYANRIMQKNKPVGLSGIVIDITDRKRAEEFLKESEERFRRIFEEGPLGMATSGTDFKFIKANAAFCRMMDYEENELTSLTFKDITHPEYITQDSEAMKKLSVGDIPIYHTEKRYMRKDKRAVWGAATITAIRDNSNRILHFIAMIEDITERKEVEEALVQSEGLFKTLVEFSPVANAVFSGKNQTIEYVSHSFTELFGYEQADVPSLSAWWPIAYPREEYRSQIEEAWRTSIEWAQRENHEPQPMESVITCKDGSTKYIESTFVLTSEHTIAFFSDLTQRRMAEESLRQTHAFNDHAHSDNAIRNEHC